MPAHAGTLDVDIVIDLQILAGAAGYRTHEENLRAMRFERSTNERGQRVSWRWQTRTGNGALMVVEPLAGMPEIAGGKVEPLPTEGNISALNIPHLSIVFEMHRVAEIRSELVGGGGIAVEVVRHADLVSFPCLKAFAFDHRFERKDAHDLVYCIERTEEGLAAAYMFHEVLEGEHGEVIRDFLPVLRNRFAGDDEVEGNRKGGLVAVALFELGESDETGLPEAWLLRQREIHSSTEQLNRRDNNTAGLGQSGLQEFTSLPNRFRSPRRLKPNPQDSPRHAARMLLNGPRHKNVWLGAITNYGMGINCLQLLGSEFQRQRGRVYATRLQLR